MQLKDMIGIILDKKLINLNLNVLTKEEAIYKLSDMLYRNNKLISEEGYVRDVLEREKHCTTGIGSGVAIPHSKSDDVKETSIAIGRLSSRIDWQSLDDKPVELVFLIAVKKEDTEEMHLRVLSFIATELMEEETVSGLLKAQSPEEVIDLLCG